MHQADFFEQPREIQERFIACITSTLDPKPFCAQTDSPRLRVAWLVGAALSLAGLAAGLLWGFGRATGGMGLVPAFFAGIYGLATWSVVFCLMRALGFGERSPPLPYPRGVYLFPVGVVDARGAKLKVHPWTELEQAPRLLRPSRLRVVISGQRFEFPLGDPGQADGVLSSIAESERRLRASTGSAFARAELDPLADSGIPSPLSPTDPLVRPHSRWWQQEGILATLPAVLLAIPLWLARNALSEASMYGHAREQNTPEAYGAYLQAGGSRPDVARVWLPRAELAQAKAVGSLAALEAVVRKYRDAHIRPELDAAVNEALRRELARATATGSVRALRALGQKYPRHEAIDQDLQAAIRALHRQGRRQLESRLLPGHPELSEFLQALFTGLERTGERIDVRFRRRWRSSVLRADELIANSPFFGGPDQLPNQYFDATHSRSRARELVALLAKSWQKGLPPGVLDFALGPEVDGEMAAWPAPERTTLFIGMEMVMSSEPFLSAAPRGAYVGIGVAFDVVFVVPGSPHTLRRKMEYWHPPDLDLLAPPRGSPKQVYENMAGDVYQQFGRELLASFFADP